MWLPTLTMRHGLDPSRRLPLSAIVPPMNCANHQLNVSRCTCSYPGCPRHAVCCDCLAYHRGMGELPACCFTPEQERTYDRSIGFFVSVNRR